MVNPYAVYCKLKNQICGIYQNCKSFSHLRFKYNFISLIFNLATQFWEELLIPTSTEFTDYKRTVKIILDYEYTDNACSMNELKILNILKEYYLEKQNSYIKFQNLSPILY